MNKSMFCAVMVFSCAISALFYSSFYRSKKTVSLVSVSFAGSQFYLVELIRGDGDDGASFYFLLVVYEDEDGAFTDDAFFMPLPPENSDNLREWVNIFATYENNLSEFLVWRSGIPMVPVDLGMRDLLTNVSMNKVRISSFKVTNSVQIDLDPLMQRISVFSDISNGEIDSTGSWGEHDSSFMQLGVATFRRLN